MVAKLSIRKDIILIDNRKNIMLIDYIWDIRFLVNIANNVFFRDRFKMY